MNAYTCNALDAKKTGRYHSSNSRITDTALTVCLILERKCPRQPGVPDVTSFGRRAPSWSQYPSLGSYDVTQC